MSDRMQQDDELRPSRPSRRRFLAMAAATLAAAAGCAPAAPPTPTPAPAAKPAAPAPTAAPKPAAAPTVATRTDRQLVVSIWGGATAEAVRKLVIPRFEKETGARVVLDEGTAGARFNKLRAQKASPTIDVFATTSENFYAGLKEDLFVKLDPANAPNLKKLYDWAIPEPGYGPAYQALNLGFAYNTEKVKNPPKKWADLWDERFRGQLGVFSFAHSMGPALLVRAAELNGGSVQNVAPGFAKLAALNPAKVYGFARDAIQLFNQGAIALYPEFNYYVQGYKDEKVPIEYVVPEDGVLMELDVLEVVNGTKNKELAERFIDIFMDAEVQAGLARTMYAGSPNKEVKLDPALTQRLVLGEKAANARRYDSKVFAEQRPRWQERFNAEVGSKWSS